MPYVRDMGGVAKKTMANRVISADTLLERARILSVWVEQLRQGRSVPEIRLNDSDPMARLGNELQLLADSLGRQEQELQRLFDLVEIVEKGVLLQDVLDRVFESFRGIIPFDRIGCAFLSEDGSALSAHWARTELGPVQISGGYSQPMAGSSLERVMKTGEPRIINDLEAYLASKPKSAATRSIVREGGRASLTCPLMVGDRPIGFLFFTSGQKNIYNPDHQDTFRRIAVQVSIVIERGRVYQQIVDRNKELLEQRGKLEECANRDALTGVLNRGAIMNFAEKAFSAANERGKPLGIIMADIDRFKRVNDSLGHAAGDLALKEFTRRVTAALRPGDVLGRYGGEEFIVVVPDSTMESLSGLAEHLRAAVAASPVKLGDETRAISASFGCALSSDAVESIDDVVAAADRALYRAKNAGRNSVVFDAQSCKLAGNRRPAVA